MISSIKRTFTSIIFFILIAVLLVISGCGGTISRVVHKSIEKHEKETVPFNALPVEIQEFFYNAREARLKSREEYSEFLLNTGYVPTAESDKYKKNTYFPPDLYIFNTDYEYKFKEVDAVKGLWISHYLLIDRTNNRIYRLGLGKKPTPIFVYDRELYISTDYMAFSARNFGSLNFDRYLLDNKTHYLEKTRYNLSTISADVIFTNNNQVNTRQMTMTSSNTEIVFMLQGDGTAIIDWGDEMPSDTVMLSYRYEYYRRLYPISISRTITITGDSITYLDCAKNRLTALDVSRNTILITLFCNDNLLVSLDVNKNTALRNLSCFNNELTSLDVSNNTALRTLFCYKNQLTVLDITNNTFLAWLNCYGNQLTTLYLSNNSALYKVDISYNCFSAADLNAIFRALYHDAEYEHIKYIGIGGNPGTRKCERQFAKRNGWSVGN